MKTNWVWGEHGNTGLWALTRGPLVYAADGLWQEKPAMGGGSPASLPWLVTLTGGRRIQKKCMARQMRSDATTRQGRT